jgi:hypothetical protein
MRQQPAAPLGSHWRAALRRAGPGRGLQGHSALDPAPAPLGLFIVGNIRSKPRRQMMRMRWTVSQTPSRSEILRSRTVASDAHLDASSAGLNSERARHARVGHIPPQLRRLSQRVAPTSPHLVASNTLPHRLIQWATSRTLESGQDAPAYGILNGREDLSMLQECGS